MAYAIMHFFPGGTKEQYEASIAPLSKFEAVQGRLSFHTSMARKTLAQDRQHALRCIRTEKPCQKARFSTWLGRPQEGGRL